MSIHSSLRSGGKGRKHRSVLKRHERLKILKDKNLWDEEKSVLGIPKVKMQKLKVKKEKVAAETVAGAPPAAGAATESAAAPSPARGGSQPGRSAGASGGKAEKK
jgi:small basic protein (TIGR04137 family)